MLDYIEWLLDKLWMTYLWTMVHEVYRSSHWLWWLLSKHVSSMCCTYVGRIIASSSRCHMWGHALDRQIGNRIVPLRESCWIILERWGLCKLLIHLLFQSVIVLVVFFEVNDYNWDVISAIVISATLIRNLFSYLYEVIAILSHFVYFLSQLIIVIN